MRLLFLINGSETSAAGVRAKMFAQRLPSEWAVEFQYRPARKWQGILLFVLAAQRFQPDIIYVMDTAYTGVLAGYIAKKLLGHKWITDTGDAAYELANSRGIYSSRQLKLIDWIEQLAISRSDWLVVRGSYHKHWLAEQGIHTVEFIPDGVDVPPTLPPPSPLLRQEMGLDQHLVVGLVGSMLWSERHQMCYGWEIVEALQFLTDLPVKGLLVGDGDGRAVLEQRAVELGVRDRIIFTGQIPYQDLPDYLALMDICVSTQSNDLVGQVRTTGKLPLYLAYGKYVIATNVGEAQRVLPGVGCLIDYSGVRDDCYPAQLAAQIRKLMDKPEVLQVQEQARIIAQENFAYDLLAGRVEQICLRLCQPGSAV